MKLFRFPRLILITGLLSLFVFSGDIVADAVADMRGHACEQTSQSSQSTPCPVCDCAVHAGAVLFTSLDPFSPLNTFAVAFPFSEAQRPLNKLPAAIDHPPQLS
jgi:hypothetical protein